MTDIFDKATRSRIMRSIKGKNTKPELRLAAACRALGLHPRKHADLPGHPDLVFGTLAVFVHGCFWHGCRKHGKAPADEGWRNKLHENVRRDRRKAKALRGLGYKVLTVWEHEKPERAAMRVWKLADPPERWIGVDLDGTLAEYHGDPSTIGRPIKAMVDRVKDWLTMGTEVRILTARVDGGGASYKHGAQWHRYRDQDAIRAEIEAWCLEHIGEVLPVTNAKEFGMIALYDDKAVQVEPNTGRIIA